jgi:hypothetical protein
MVVGVYHFDTPGRDLFNPSIPEIMGERRQKEIQVLVDQLAQFKPTKICIESRHTSDVFQKRLDSYWKGEYDLKQGERDQLGLRLAKQLGHKSIYPVDVPSDMAFDPVMKKAEELNKMDFIDQLMAETGTFLASIFDEDVADKLTMSQVLAKINSEEADAQNHGTYLKLATIAEGDDFPGVEMLGEWYKRNLKISVNLFSQIENEGERILLIIGSGHAKIIRDAIQDMPNVDNVSPLKYLQPDSLA